MSLNVEVNDEASSQILSLAVSRCNKRLIKTPEKQLKRSIFGVGLASLELGRQSVVSGVGGGDGDTGVCVEASHESRGTTPGFRSARVFEVVDELC
jgi:hypothetical protein